MKKRLLIDVYKRQLYNMLKNSNVSYDVIIPSDYMISKLISEGTLRQH